MKTAQKQTNGENRKNSKEKSASGVTSSSPGQATSSSSSSSTSPWITVLIAVVSLILGVLTPPLLKKPNKFPFSSSPANVDNRALKKDQALLLRQVVPCTDENLALFLHETPVSGFHIACFAQDANEEQIQIKFYRGGTNDVTTKVLDADMPWSVLRDTIQGTLQLTPPDELHQPWALFSTIGDRLVESDEEETTAGYYAELLTSQYGMVLVYGGGQFVWPGVRIGFRRSVDLYSIMADGSLDTSTRNRTVTLETISLIPLVISVKGFLTETECEHVQRLAEPHIQYSGVVLMDHDAGRAASDFRTSQTTFVSAKDAIMLDIDYRTASLVRIPRNHQETVQVLRYGYMEKYVSHHDYFDPQLYQNDANTLRLIGNGRRNRMATVFWYLSDVEEGGETVFPRFNNGREKSFSDCETGLKVKPEAGKVIIFYSLTPDGSRDPNSLHGACPVKQGIKWAANKWVWNSAMGYVPS